MRQLSGYRNFYIVRQRARVALFVFLGACVVAGFWLDTAIARSARFSSSTVILANR